MKETIAFPQLVELVAQKANTTERMSELFLQELFAVVTQELTDGKSVTIKGLGSFKVTNGESGKDVVFIPDKDLAEAVNAPFAQFEPVELCDEVTDEMLSEIDTAMEQSAQNEDIETQPASSENVGTRHAVSEDKQKNKETEPVSLEENQEEENQEENNVGTRRALSEPAQKEPQEEPLDGKAINPRIWLIATAVAVALIVVWYFFTHRDKDRSDIAAETTHVAKDTTNDAKNVKPQPIVTDTLGGNNVIFTMAKKHYGDQAFWVYIARENQVQYPDYRKIPAGTVLVIPPAEKYGINSDSKQSLKKANAEAMKLYKEVKALDNKEQKEDTTITDLSSQNKPTKGKSYKSSRKYHNKYSSHKRHYRRRR